MIEPSPCQPAPVPPTHPPTQVEGLPVYGVAIPTVRGVRNVLDQIGAAQGACECVCLGAGRVCVCGGGGQRPRAPPHPPAAS